MRATMEQPPKRKSAYVAGHIRRIDDRRPCLAGAHVGPFIRAAKFEQHPDPFWHQHGLCGRCGSCITPDDIRRA
jgi:hypothetical protein